MTDNLREMDGVGPAREEKLEALGYETYEALAAADPESLAEEIPRLSGDTALSLVVQAENMTDLEEATVEEQPTSSEGAESGSEESDEEDEALAQEDAETVTEAAESDSAEADDCSEPHDVQLQFSSAEEYDSFLNTVYQHRNTLLQTNRDEKATSYEQVIEEMRGISPDETLVLELTDGELNDLHNAVRSKATEYQGDGLIAQMEALNRVTKEVNKERERHLF